MKTRLFIMLMGALWLVAQISSANAYDDDLPTDLISPHGTSDVVFLLYATNENHFELMKWYVKYLLSKVKIDDGKVRVGVVKFSSDVNIMFHLKDYSTESEINTAIDDIPYDQSRVVANHKALYTMRTEMFTSDNGDRTEAENVCILMTIAVGLWAKNEAQEVHNASIHIYCVGFGVTDRVMLDAIASPSAGGKSNSFNVENFAVLETFREGVLAVTTTETTETTTTALMTTTPRPTTQPTTTTTTAEPYACMDGKFGQDCTKTCRCSNKSEVCDKFTGNCVSGCLAGWKGTDCHRIDCSHYCGIHTCVELRHDYSCSCLDGYENSDSHHCEDIDECKQDDICDIHTCRNDNGSFDCICNSRLYYENIHRQICVVQAIDPDKVQLHSTFLIQGICVLVIERSLSIVVILFVVINLLLCEKTVVMAIHRYFTTVPYKPYACPFNTRECRDGTSLDIIPTRYSRYYSCYIPETDDTYDDNIDVAPTRFLSIIPEIFETENIYHDIIEDDDDIIGVPSTRFHSIFPGLSKTGQKMDDTPVDGNIREIEQNKTKHTGRSCSSSSIGTSSRRKGRDKNVRGYYSTYSI